MQLLEMLSVLRQENFPLQYSLEWSEDFTGGKWLLSDYIK